MASGHQDLRVPARPVRDRHRLRGAQRQHRALGRQRLRADPAQRPADQALDVQRRQLRLPRAGAARWHQVPQARHQRCQGCAPGDRCERRLDRSPAAPLRQRHRAAAGCAVALLPQRPGPAVPARRQRPGADRGTGGLGAVHADTVHRAEAAGAAQGHLTRTRARRRLRPPVGAGEAAVHAAGVGARGLGQLGHRDHRRHLPAQAGVLPAVGGQRPLDGEDEERCSRASRTCRTPTRTTARSSARR